MKHKNQVKYYNFLREWFERNIVGNSKFMNYHTIGKFSTRTGKKRTNRFTSKEHAREMSLKCTGLTKLAALDFLNRR